MTLFLIQYIHENLDFGVQEVHLLLHNHKYEVVKSSTSTHPFEILDTSPQAMHIISEKSIFTKNISYLLTQNENYKNIKNENFAFLKPQSAKIETITFGLKINTQQKKEIIQHFIPTLFSTPINLTNPEFTLQIYLTKCKVYVGYKFSTTKRKEKMLYLVKNRPFIGHTSLDSELSICMANMCLVKENDFVFDPCVGSGSTLLAAATFKAYVFGADLRKYELVGHNLQKGNVRTSLLGSNIYSNFKMFKFQKYFLGCLAADMFKLPLLPIPLFDCILADPPYGVRTSLQGFKEVSFYVSQIEKIANTHLRKGGRVGIWVPHTAEPKMEHFFEYKILAKCTQKLSTYSRTLFVFQKVDK